MNFPIRLADGRNPFRDGPGLRVLVQIPCYNEAETLPAVLAAIPELIDGVGPVEIQVIDDGSDDDTVEVARRHGVHHILQQKGNKGLARSFQTGIEHAVRLGADIIVNTDGDNQYSGCSIPDLVRPIAEGRADIVLGDRRPGENRAFSPVKRWLQRCGSAVVRVLSGIDAPDAVTGFRAYSRDAALSITVMTRFSYTVETLIHAGQRGLTVVSVPVETHVTPRPSRLARTTRHFISRQLVTMLRSCLMYRSLETFLVAGLAMGAIGVLPILRFLWFYAIGEGDGHVQSLILGSVLVLAGYFTVVVAFLSDIVGTNRRLTEEALIRLRRLESDKTDRPAPGHRTRATVGHD
ncbi:glycosyltransferase family 2 protein [Rhodovulum sp. 12E13]|uniref:glycosyltransferase family 2 protein n=1 Tax=Rhodovulum sp. 12E13 TaxID=2203891 RepID=UPI000E1819BA|nr:glycosyltransferase family 2 protein [Rhodovulum sp. 12E13]RDC68009.1 glycosyltransferase family 2 protein [Rhodovulum sp. 12E13]